MSRRAPLSNIPNAVNSPFRITTAGKRPRSQSTIQREAIYGQPPSKKQATEASVVITPRRAQQETVDHKRPPKKDTKGRHRQEREGTVTDITTWQAQYGAMFPKYTFYIEHYHPYVIKRAVDIIVHCGGVLYTH